MVNGLIRDTYYVPVISDDEVVGVIEISRDITDLDRVQKENQEAMFKLRSLYQHTLSLDEANTEEEAYWITYKALKNSLEGVFFDLFLRKDDTMVESFAENTMSVSKEDKGVIARTFREGKTQLLNDTSSDPDYIAVERDAMRSELAVPIKIGEKVIGVINVEDETTGRFSDQDQWLLEIFASNISNTIERIKTVEELKRTNRISEAIIHGLRKILGNETFEYTARSIFDILRELIGAKAGYVALLSEDGSNNEVLFLEAGGDPCSVDPKLPMPIRGLREQAYQTGRAVFENDFFNSKWWDFLPEGHVFMKNVLFAPLNIEGKTVGVMGLANKETGFTQEDAQIAESFGELAALALTHSRYLEKIQQDERELEASERRYKNLFENLLGGYAYHKIILGEDGNPVDYMFLEVNQGFERLTGLKRENIIGKNITEVIPNIENDEVNWIKIYGEVALKGTKKQFESFSEPLEKYFSVSAYSNEEGYFATLFYDITDQKEEERKRLKLERDLVEERLAFEKTKEISEIKNNFMSTATHEIRTPITSIKGYVELLKEGFMTGDEKLQNQALTVLSRNINRLEKLADDLLDAQRIEANKLEITKTRVNIPQFVKVIENEIAPILDEKHQKLVVTTDIEAEVLLFDELRISQVLINLLNNASYYSDAKKTIHLIIKETKENMVFKVVDKGIGLSKEDIIELFKPFPNIPMRTIKRGTGLGLSISKSIVELHKGRIWAESDGVGRGSTFCFSLPK